MDIYFETLARIFKDLNQDPSKILLKDLAEIVEDPEGSLHRFLHTPLRYLLRIINVRSLVYI